jgi:hypothetical protein
MPILAVTLGFALLAAAALLLVWAYPRQPRHLP